MQFLKSLQIKTERGVIAFSAGVVASFVFLDVSGSTHGIMQAILFVVGMALLWYVSHPLSHCSIAKIYRVSTLYFYIGRSEMRKVKTPFSKLISKYLVTVGTKLDRKKFSALSPNSRALVMGSGAIVSTILSALVLIYALARDFGTFALLFGGLFFFANLVTEILLSTKAGDLKKMKEELRKKTG